MKITVDNQQRITTAMVMLLEFYKVMMATLLVVFVPQDCNGKVCSLSENFTNSEDIHLVALISNFITFTFVLNFYKNEIIREEWCIKYLDIDPEKSNNHLDQEIEDYHIYKDQMKILNQDYLNSLYLSAGLLLSNFGISGIAIGYNFLGTNTLTSIISFLLLLSEKLYSSYIVGIKSVHDERAFSAYMKISRTYNTIDQDFKNKNDVEDKPHDIVNITHNDIGDITRGTGNVVVEMMENTN